MNHKEKLEVIRKSFGDNSPVFSHEAVNVLFEEISLLQAEVERLRLYTDPRLFAAASDVLEVAGKGSDEEVDLALVMLTEAVAWWDSLPFDPAKDVKQLPKYEG